MNAQAISKAASIAVRQHIGSVSRIVLEAMELAYVAQWLYDQDNPALAAKTACEAIRLIKDRYT